MISIDRKNVPKFFKKSEIYRNNRNEDTIDVGFYVKDAIIKNVLDANHVLKLCDYTIADCFPVELIHYISNAKNDEIEILYQNNREFFITFCSILDSKNNKFSVLKSYYVENTIVKDFDDANHLLKVCDYWNVDCIPVELLEYILDTSDDEIELLYQDNGNYFNILCAIVNLREKINIIQTLKEFSILQSYYNTNRKLSLEAASQNGRLDILIKNKQKLNKYLLEYAAVGEHINCVKFINEYFKIEDYHRALCYSCHNDNLDCFKYLEAFSINKDYNIYLFVSVKSSSIKCVSYILEQIDDLNEEYREILYQECFKKGNIKILKLLIEHGIDLPYNLDYVEYNLECTKFLYNKVHSGYSRVFRWNYGDISLKNSNLEILKFLNIKNASRQHLIQASHNFKCFKFLLETCVKIVEKHYLSKDIIISEEIIRNLILHDNVEGLKLALKLYTKLNNDRLRFAVSNNSYRCFELLVSRGRKIDFQTFVEIIDNKKIFLKFLRYNDDDDLKNFVSDKIEFYH